MHKPKRFGGIRFNVYNRTLGMEERKKRPKRKIILPLLALLLLIALIAIFIRNMSGPAEGSVAYNAPTQSAVQPLAENPHTYSGQAISFEYPSTYNLSSLKKASGMVDQVILVSNNHTSTQAAIAVVQEAVANDSGINYRKLHPGLYKQQRDAFGNLVYVKSQNGSEYTGIIVRGGLVASVSLSTTFNRDLASDYNSIVKNLQWKQ